MAMISRAILQSLCGGLGTATSLVVFALSCSIASGAALVPVPPLAYPQLAAGLEPNRGQAGPDGLFVTRGTPSFVVSAQSVLYSPLGVQLTLLGSNANPAVRFSDQIQGVVHSFTGSDPKKWLTGIPRFATAHLAEAYPGIEVVYTTAADGQLTLSLICRPGADPTTISFEIAKAVQMEIESTGSLVAWLGGSVRVDPYLVYPAAVAFQETASGAHLSRSLLW